MVFTIYYFANPSDIILLECRSTEIALINQISQSRNSDCIHCWCLLHNHSIHANKPASSQGTIC